MLGKSTLFCWAYCVQSTIQTIFLILKKMLSIVKPIEFFPERISVKSGPGSGSAAAAATAD